MTDEELFDVLRPLVLKVTGVPECIMSYPNAPAPTGPYASINVNQVVDQRGQANIFRTDNDAERGIDVTVKAQIIATCSVQFYRAGSKNYARKLLQANKRPDVSIDLFRAKVGWNRAGPVNDLSGLQSSQIEERAQLNIYLMYETSDTVTINRIESVQLINEYGETGEQVSDDTIPKDTTTPTGHNVLINQSVIVLGA